MHRPSVVLGLVAALVLALQAAAQAPTMSWQDAVAELARERTRAETCAGLLKLHAADETGALSRGALAYGEAKSEVDGAIEGLIVALAQGAEPESLAALETRLRRGVEEREAFCAQALALVPAESGTKGAALIGLIGQVVGPIVTAAKDLIIHFSDAQAAVRATIQTRLEAARWRDFADIPPAEIG